MGWVYSAFHLFKWFKPAALLFSDKSLSLPGRCRLLEMTLSSSPAKARGNLTCILKTLSSAQVLR